MRILLFDIDGTLLLTNGGGQRALEIALQNEFGVESPVTDITYSGRTDRSIFDELLHRNNLEITQHHRKRLGSHYSRLLPEVLECRGGRILPGVPELLEAVQDHQELLPYVMTGNLESTATAKLKYFGLQHFFRGIFGGQHDKDRNDLAHRATRLLHQELVANESTTVDTMDIVVIGDTPADIECGRAIGAQSIAVCTGNHSRASLEAASPIAVHDDLSDLGAVMQLLVGNGLQN